MPEIGAERPASVREKSGTTDTPCFYLHLHRRLLFLDHGRFHLSINTVGDWLGLRWARENPIVLSVSALS